MEDNLIMGPCMCGDPYCSSCGPAQGNFKCPHCGVWSADGGCMNPAECAEADRKWCDEMAAEARMLDAFDEADIN